MSTIDRRLRDLEERIRSGLEELGYDAEAIAGSLQPLTRPDA